MNNILRKIQTIFKVTKSEIYVASILLFGLIIGVTASNFKNDHTKNIIISGSLFDSLKQEQILAANFDNYSTNKAIENSEETFQNNNLNDTIVTNYNAKTNYNERSKKLTSGSNKTINLNIAMKSELMQLPGVGEKTAEAIIEWRKTRKFNRPSDILNIKGIGPAKFNKMKEFIIVK